MLHRLAFASLLGAALVAPALGDQVILFEDFESYTDSSALLSAWPSSVAERPDNATRLIEGDTVGDDDGAFYGGTNLTKFAQFCAGANSAAGIAGCDSVTGNAGVAGGNTVNLMNFDTINPSATQNIELSVDIGDDAFSANKRITFGLRSTTPANLIELGFYNAISTTPHFSYRGVLFSSGDIALDPANSGWSVFSEDTIDQPLPPELDSPSEVGRGFHTFKAVISLTQITYSLDLYADGLQNDPLDPVPGVGTEGVDALDVIDAVINPVGFNQVRFGPPSAISGSGNINEMFAAFDNISLKLVDIQAPTGNADFDGDGDVDGRDFLTWQRGFGTPSAELADGDANDDDAVDGLDLAIWQDQYGPGALASVSAVPEPGTGLLLLAATALFAIRRK